MSLELLVGLKFDSFPILTSLLLSKFDSRMTKHHLVFERLLDFAHLSVHFFDRHPKSLDLIVNNLYLGLKFNLLLIQPRCSCQLFTLTNAISFTLANKLRCILITEQKALTSMVIQHNVMRRCKLVRYHSNLHSIFKL